jgi:DNA mismatch repair protein MSH6
MLTCSPQIQAKKAVNYAESSDDEDPFVSMRASQARRRNKARATVIDDDDEDDYNEPADYAAVQEDDEGKN